MVPRMEYRRTTVIEALKELSCSEFKIWVALHTLTDRERKTTAAALSRRWELNDRVVQETLRVLVDKGYIVRELAHKKFFYVLKRRLDVSAGQFLKFSV